MIIGNMVKSELKKAKDAIKDKDYKAALSICKDILREDRNNYNALVFVGVCTQELGQCDQAFTAFKRATQLEPKQALAWQGLASFLEKVESLNEEMQEDLISTYCTLITMLSDKEKVNNYQMKLLDHLKIVSNFQILISKLQEALESGTHSNVIIDPIVDILTKSNTFKEYELLETFIDTHKSILVNDIDLSFNISALCVHHFLLESGKFFCEFLLTKSTNNTAEVIVSYMQLICGEYVSSNVLDRSALNGILSRTDEKSDLHHLIHGIILVTDGQYMQSVPFLTMALSLSSEKHNTSIVRLFLTLGYLGIHQYDKAESVCVDVNGGQNNRTLDIIQSAIILCKCRALVHKEHVDEKWRQMFTNAVTSNHISTNLKEILVCDVVLKFIDDDMYSQVEDIHANLEQNSQTYRALNAYLLNSKHEYYKALRDINEAMNDITSNAQYYFIRGLIIMNILREQRGDDLTPEKDFIQSVKLDPYNYKTFYNLGKYYEEVDKNDGRAMKCYEKAFSINNSDNEVNECLSDIYYKLGKNTENKQLLLVVTNICGRGFCHWAWLRLGLILLNEKDYTESIRSFQSAILADPDNPHSWECLAQAYMTRGSYTAALKAYTKVLTIDPDAYFSVYQLGRIKQVLSQYTDACGDYKVLLEKVPGYLPALQSLSETLNYLARISLTQFLDARAVDYCLQSIVNMDQALNLNPNMSCLWKLLGDACTILHSVDDEIVVNKFDGLHLHTLKLLHYMDAMCLTKVVLLEVGGRAYGMSIKLQPQAASVWYDLAVNLHRQWQQTHQSQIVHSALACAKKAVSLQPTVASHWNCLGVISASNGVNLSLAQHAFITSLNLEQTVEVWANLGMLYIECGKPMLAHEAFNNGQSLSPDNSECWIGQALICERQAKSAQDVEETLDLFRHSTDIKEHPEGCLAFAEWICRVLMDRSSCYRTEHVTYILDNMSGLLFAVQCAHRYTTRYGGNYGGYNLQGLLCELIGWNKQAAQSFKAAFDVLAKGKRLNSFASNEVSKNYIRAASKAGLLEDISQFMNEFSNFNVTDDIFILCQMALGSYKYGNIKESYVKYDKALKVCDKFEDFANDEVKASTQAEIVTALGMVAYKFGDYDGCKTLLFQNSQIAHCSYYGLLALGSLAILQENESVATAVLQEIKSNQLGIEFHKERNILEACYCMSFKTLSSGLQSVSKYVHTYPGDGMLWNVLAEYLYVSGRYTDAMNICHMPILNEYKYSDTNILLCNILCKLAVGNVEEAVKDSQRYVHLYPFSAISRYMLAVSLYALKQLTSGAAVSMTLITKFIVSTLHSNTELELVDLKQWMKEFLVWCYMLSGNILEASELLNSISDKDKQFSHLLESLLTERSDNVGGAGILSMSADTREWWLRTLSQKRYGITNENSLAFWILLTLVDNDALAQWFKMIQDTSRPTVIPYAVALQTHCNSQAQWLLKAEESGLKNERFILFMKVVTEIKSSKSKNLKSDTRRSVRYNCKRIMTCNTQDNIQSVCNRLLELIENL